MLTFPSLMTNPTLPSPSAKHLRLSSFAASSALTLPLFGNRPQTKCPKQSCTCSLTTAKTSCKTVLSANCTRKSCSRSFCTKTTRSRTRGRSARSCSVPTKRRRRSLARSCRCFIYTWGASGLLFLGLLSIRCILGVDCTYLRGRCARCCRDTLCAFRSQRAG